MSNFDDIEQWAARVSSRAKQSYFSRHIDEFAVGAVPASDAARLMDVCSNAFRALCRGVTNSNVRGITCSLLIPLEPQRELPDPAALNSAFDFLRVRLHSTQPPGLYVLPKHYLHEWDDDLEDYRLPFDPAGVIDAVVDSAFVGYYRSPDEIEGNEDYSAAVYLFRYFDEVPDSV
jgi:hypothetical protein